MGNDRSVAGRIEAACPGAGSGAQQDKQMMLQGEKGEDRLDLLMRKA